MTTLILLPGLACDARLWTHQVEALADLCDPIIVNLTATDTMSGLAEAVLAAAPPGPFALAGLSMGGYCALEIMRRAPERVSALALLDTNARADTDAGKENRLALIESAERDFGATIESLLPKLVHPDRVGEEAVGGLTRAMTEANGKDIFIRQQHAIMSRTDSRSHLGAITCPTLVLCGRDDVLTPVVVHEELVAGIPGATLTVVEHCGHLSPIERPDEVSAALRRWLQA